MKLLPEILTHPNIPKPMHGINPRTIMGDAWWNKIRQEVYASTNYHCIACGTHKSEVLGKNKWLEAHEFWEIDYILGECRINGIYPLCPYCHSFIHSGRLSKLIESSKISKDEAIKILEHGFKILQQNNLQCFMATHYLAKEIGANTFGVTYYYTYMNHDIIESKLMEPEWNDWYLIWEGKKYKSQFQDFQDWKNFYSKYNGQTI